MATRSARGPLKKVRESQPPSRTAAAVGILRRWCGPVLCATAFFLLITSSWRKWPDVLVDFGHELYIPWQLAAGKVLYRDIAFLYGPFSQYLNAFWFRLFGVSLTTLIFCNAAILAGLTWMVYRMLADACDRLVATAACLVLLFVFGFAHYPGIGNYNFICPYSHEATHGVVLSIAMIFCLSRAGRRPYLMCGLAGLCLGLVLLTRVELAVAAAVVLLTWVAIGLSLRGFAVGFRWKPVLVLLAAAAVPALGFFIYFWGHMPAGQAMKAVGGAYVVLLTSRVAENLFFKEGMGLDEPGGNLLLALRVLATIGIPLLALAAIDRLTRRWSRLQTVLGVVLAMVTLAALFDVRMIETWTQIGRPLPLLSLLAWLAVTVMLLRRRRDPAAVVRLVPLVLWAVFGTVLLGKMFLKARLSTYGFYLAMPATVVCVVGLLWLAPGLLRRGSAGGRVFRWVALASVVSLMAFHLRVSETIYNAKTYAVGTGGDRIFSYSPEIPGLPMALGVATTLEQIERLMPREATFIALPEGVMLNYLSRRVNPTPYINVMMVEILAFGEDAMLAGMKQHPPDFVILVHKDTSEFGVGLFGGDPRYGRKIMEWVNAEYQIAALIGEEPLKDPEQFGIKIMRRRANLAPGAG
jgi:hypothetical protein